MSKNYGLTGISENVELSQGGPRVKNSSGVIEARNAADDAYVILRAANGSASNDVVTKAQLDSAIEGLDVLESAVYATTADLGTVTYDNGTLGVGATITRNTSYEAFAPDGTQAVAGQRILVKDQTSAEENGVYTVTEVGNAVDTFWVLTRVTDFDEAAEIEPGDFVFIESGTANAATGWVQTGSVATVGTDSISWTQFSSVGAYTAGDGLDLSTLQFSVDVTDVIDTAAGLTETANDIQINLESDGAIQFDGGNGGLEIKPDVTTGTTVAPLTVGANGAGVTVDEDTIEHSAGTLSAKDSLQYKKVDFAYDTASPFNVGSALPTGAYVIGWVVRVSTIFDGTTPILDIGDAGDDDAVAPDTHIDLTTLGIYKGDSWVDESSAQVTGTLTLSGASQGAGSILIKYAT
jgi:hypothetical protein